MRPPRIPSRQLVVTVPADIYAKIEREAARAGTSKAAVSRTALKKGLEEV